MNFIKTVLLKTHVAKLSVTLDNWYGCWVCWLSVKSLGYSPKTHTEPQFAYAHFLPYNSRATMIRKPDQDSEVCELLEGLLLYIK